MNASGRVCLLIKNTAAREWSLEIGKRRKTIGRSQTADVRVPRRFRHVSRIHAELWQDEEGIWISDLQSRYGTHINGVWITHVSHAALVLGDSIWMGGLECEISATQQRHRFDSCWEGLDDDTPTGHELELQYQHPVYERLTVAGIDVLLWLGRGVDKENEIGDFLEKSPNTVLNQINSIYRKLELHSRSELMGWIKKSTARYPFFHSAIT